MAKGCRKTQCSAKLQCEYTKSVRDQFNLLTKKYKVKMGKQESNRWGGGKKATEAENLQEELIAIEEDTNEKADEESRARQIVEDQDKGNRDVKAMKSMGETRERLGKKSEEKRRSGNQSMVFLEKAIETKQMMQKEEKRGRAGDTNCIFEAVGSQSATACCSV
ncbi:Hypothetical predicted protein [Paramuricea clavata]|uniref:Uncharacterized protein n=1 Tax=Paramuricea clavata TaxID=317549 RepID=A0A7D9HBS5_PARCT|nr:Hypothetical predicted protein [Paramuricea clavata]